MLSTPDIVLDTKRMSLLDKWGWTKDMGFYLAGGTALALYYGHRISEDFDFFKEGDLDQTQILDMLDRQDINYSITYQVPNTLYIDVNGVKVSFIAVKNLKLIESLVDYNYFFMASIKDIGVMKLAVIPARREMKDYVDLYYICQDHSIDELIELVKVKYNKEINLWVLKKALLYTDDLLDNVVFVKGKEVSEKQIRDFWKKRIG